MGTSGVDLKHFFVYIKVNSIEFSTLNCMSEEVRLVIKYLSKYTNVAPLLFFDFKYSRRVV